MWMFPIQGIHYRPSMMSQGKTPWKDPQVSLQGSEGSFQVKYAWKDPSYPFKPTLGDLSKGSFPGTSLTVHSVLLVLLYSRLSHLVYINIRCRKILSLTYHNYCFQLHQGLIRQNWRHLSWY